MTDAWVYFRELVSGSGLTRDFSFLLIQALGGSSSQVPANYMEDLDCVFPDSSFSWAHCTLLCLRSEAALIK